MFRNKYIQRRVDTSDAKPCFICYKPTTCVLLNEEPGADFFYACESHLLDRGFARKDSVFEQQEKTRNEEQTRIEQLRVEWETKQLNKSNTSHNSSNVDTTDVSTSAPASTQVPPSTSIRPTYELNNGVFMLRVNSKKQKVHEKKTRSILETPGAFPSVPTHKPS